MKTGINSINIIKKNNEYIIQNSVIINTNTKGSMVNFLDTVLMYTVFIRSRICLI